MKFYAVKKGRKPGIYRNWEETKAQIDGFSGAEYKSFTKITDATDYLDWNAQTHGEILQESEDTLQAALKKIKTKTRELKQENKQVMAKSKSKPQSKPKIKENYFATTYTDGGTRNTGVYKGGHVKKTDKAAWAYRIEWGEGEVHEAGGEYGATNNKMEQTALINALKKLIELGFNEKKLHFVLDSQYVLNAINKGWLASWKKRGWKRSKGPLANTAEWQELDRLLKQFPDATFDWTKGHANNRGNEFVDHLLNKYMDEKM
ncbi:MULTISPECIES: ribonuclease H family protein [Lactobacillus]|uniref:Ribonuclease H n=1 Tax=Lactobacillus xujianguonis TaxID=2495899 RepID=A0A437SVZ7_9LACO|nr:MULTISPECIES: ribonuclease H family protein [Lactobacillus]RVU71062.1 ribonuclease [Lactobacillus xujianguonis]RVU76782.1 ribonuclease [Lactobacillus xujianguonis]